jgi:hypothetical protein
MIRCFENALKSGTYSLLWAWAVVAWFPSNRGYLRTLGGFRGFWRPGEAAPSRKTRLGLDNPYEGVRVLLTGDLALQKGA